MTASVSLFNRFIIIYMTKHPHLIRNVSSCFVFIFSPHVLMISFPYLMIVWLNLELTLKIILSNNWTSKNYNWGSLYFLFKCDFDLSLFLWLWVLKRTIKNLQHLIQIRDEQIIAISSFYWVFMTERTFWFLYCNLCQL